MRRSSSATIRRCAASPSSSAGPACAASSAPPRTRRASSACTRRCRPRARKRLCPDGVFVPPDFERYREASRQIRDDLRAPHAARRAAVARRGLPRRDRGADGHSDGDGDGGDDPARDPRRHSAHRVGRRRTEQVPGEDRIRLAQAGRACSSSARIRCRSFFSRCPCARSPASAKRRSRC